MQKGLEKEEREKEITFPQKVFLSRINILLSSFLKRFFFLAQSNQAFFPLKKRQKKDPAENQQSL